MINMYSVHFAEASSPSLRGERGCSSSERLKMQIDSGWKSSVPTTDKKQLPGRATARKSVNRGVGETGASEDSSSSPHKSSKLKVSAGDVSSVSMQPVTTAFAP